MTDITFETLARLRKISAYFKRHSDEDALFAPEHKAAEQVIEIIEGNSSKVAVREQIVEVVRGIEETKHYNGSGWLEFKMIIHSWLGSDDE